MVIVGELINANRKAIAEAIKSRDAGAVQALARQQHDAGEDYIDVNAEIFLAEALAGRDGYCMNYMKAFRAKRFEL